MQDRRGFLGRLAGAIAGLAAAPHVKVEEAKAAPELPAAASGVAESSTPFIHAAPRPGFLPPSRDNSRPFSREFVGGGFRHVTVDGHPIEDVWEIKDYGYPPRADGSFWGKVVAFRPAEGVDPEQYICRVGLSGAQGFTYNGCWVKFDEADLIRRMKTMRARNSIMRNW